MTRKPCSDPKPVFFTALKIRLCVTYVKNNKNEVKLI